MGCERAASRLLQLCAEVAQLQLALAQLRSGRLERPLALRGRLFAPLDGRAPELDGAELLLPPGDLVLPLLQPRLALAELDRVRGQLCLPLVELGRPESQHLLDRAAEAGSLLLAALEALDRCLQTRRLRLDLPPALGDERLDGLVVGRREEPPQPVAEPVVGASAAGPMVPRALLSRVFLHGLAS